MLFTLEALKAKEGDCLLLHWGSVASPRLGVIDGGPGRVYEDFLRVRLDEIASRRGVNPLEIDLVMVSHADSDHVNGIMKLYADLVEDLGKQALKIRAERLWHNIFDDIIGNALNAHYDKFTASFEASATGAPRPGTVDTLTAAFQGRDHSLGEDEARHLAWDMALVLAGHKEARQLRDSHKKLHDANLARTLNSPFQNTLITAELTSQPLAFHDLQFRITGPLQAEIDALQLEFDQFLRDRNLATAEAALAAYADKSAKNLSSIVCIVEAGEGAAKRSMLLTGDARGDKILDGLRKVKRLGKAKSANVHFNLLKVPHHGSDHNAEPDFFKAITADHYVLSGDGKHGNPERDTVDWIIASREKSAKFSLVFTYPVAEIDRRRKTERGAKWVERDHSLAELLQARSNEGFNFTIVEGAPVKIELGDETIAW